MRVLLAAFGSRGDVQPMVALGHGFRAEGHAVRFAVPPESADWVRGFGFPCDAVGLDYQAVLAQVGPRVFKAMRLLRQEIAVQFRDLAPLVDEAELMVGSSLSCAGASLAKARGIPHRQVSFGPAMLPSSHHPSLLLPWQALPRWANRASWGLQRWVFNRGFLAELDAHRARLGLPPAMDVWGCLLGDEILVASEPSLSPVAPDARLSAVQTGAWFLPSSEGLDPALEQFLSEGPPPVYLGFGSMSDRGAGRDTRLLLDAVARAGVRALLSRGWAGLGDGPLPETVRVIGPCPHDRLFSRVAAVVHHGGAGTTAAAARAGVPQVVVPHVLDQFHWAERTLRLGLSAATLPKARLSAAGLAQAMMACRDDGALRERARAFAAGMIEDGVARAVRALEALATGGAPSSARAG